jgi:hypothetical protein
MCPEAEIPPSAQIGTPYLKRHERRGGGGRRERGKWRERGERGDTSVLLTVLERQKLTNSIHYRTQVGPYIVPPTGHLVASVDRGRRANTDSRPTFYD